MSYTTTVTGSYPRKEVQKDTLRKPSVSEEESFEMIKWAVKEQSDLGLDIITDGEGYRENMYWFYQLRLDGVDAINKIRKDFTLGGSMKGVDLSKTHGTKGFGIECAVVKDEIKNLKTGLAKKWKMARDNTPSKFPVMTFDKKLHDFGTIMDGEAQETVFSYTNTGEAPLVITEIKSTCGCTVPQDWSRAPLLPGESSQFTVKFNGKGMNKTSKTVTIKANTNNWKFSFSFLGNKRDDLITFVI